MTKWGKTEFDQFRDLATKLETYTKTTTILEDVAKELTARLLAKVIPRTPVGQYPKSSGKVGGTLRRGWTVDTEKEALSGKNVDVATYVDDLEMNVKKDYVEVIIINPVEYAVYVEKGHRTRNKKDWVSGRHMLRISVEELRQEQPMIIKNKIAKELREVFK